MKLSVLQAQAKKIAWITLAWTIFSLFQFLIGWGALIEMNIDPANYNVIPSLRASILTGVTGGLLGGTTLVFLWEGWFRNRAYGMAILSILGSYTVIFMIVAVVRVSYFYATALNISFLDPALWVKVFQQLATGGVVIPYVVWFVAVSVTMIWFLVNDKYGPGIFSKFLVGKYIRPHREERIFMFLDLRSSTSIAEKLGEDRYFSFLKDVFRVATPGILEYKGEVYQYVGDEIVVSWEMGAGIENGNCINSFYRVQALVSMQTEYFQSTYDIIPELKAGLHSGAVMAGEIGIVKREIAYSGDAINTAARIQSKCNELGVNILSSKRLLDKIANLDEAFMVQEIGEMELRGKTERLILCTV